MTHLPTLKDAIARTATAYAPVPADAADLFPPGSRAGSPAFGQPARSPDRVRSIRVAVSAAALAAGLLLAATGCESSGRAGSAEAAGYDPQVIDLSAPAARPASPRSTEMPTLMVAAPLTADTPASSPDDSSFPTIDFASPAAPVAYDDPAAGPRRHTVAKGETLYALAASYYGSGKQWPRIADANPGVTPARLPAGQTIVIP